MLNKLKLQLSDKRGPSVSFLPRKDGTNKIVILIDHTIILSDQFNQAINALLEADENDDVDILLNTPGGVVDTCMMFTHAMKQCKAHIRTVAMGGVIASCGAIIFSHGDSLAISKASRVMFHQASGGFFGTMRSIKEGADTVEKLMLDLLKPAMDKGFFTDESLKEMLSSKLDVYLTYKDIKELGVDCEII